MDVKSQLPSVGMIVKTAIAVVILFALADLLGFQKWILSPVSAWKNRGVE